MSVPHGVNHFCRLSDLLSETTKTFQQADYIIILVIVLWLIPPSLRNTLLCSSKHLPCDVHVSQSPRAARLELPTGVVLTYKNNVHGCQHLVQNSACQEV
jgi:hypothetical protein